ncbi:MAG TPA: hypothetical protein VF698_03750, partial [Thermoanaerobaculia bacterium]
MNRNEKITVAAATLVASLAIIVAANAARPVASKNPASPAPQMTRAEQVERGKYLVTIGGCHDC